MQAYILDQEKSRKNRKTILREEKSKKKKRKKMKDVRKVEKELLREVTVKIGLERIDMQEEIIVEMLLNSGAIGLVMSSEFVKKQQFGLRRIEKSIYVRNVDGMFNKEEPIENTVEINIYYQGYRERIEIDVISGQKWSLILEMPWLAFHNPEIDWKIGEMKITRCLEECKKQQRLKQEKLEWQKQKKEEKKQEEDRGKSGRRIGNLGQGRENTKIRERGKEISAKAIS